MTKLPESMIDVNARTNAIAMGPDAAADLIGYWSHGHRILATQLAEANRQARSEEWYSHAPMGLSPDAARGWLSARVDTLRHALEMMGIPEGHGLEVPKAGKPTA